MSKINYNQWINGECCQQKPCDCNGGNACDCEAINAAIERLQDDDVTLQDQIYALSAITSGGSGVTIVVDAELSSSSTNPVQNKVITSALSNKLDLSAYTPTDLSDYYTKQESDARYQTEGDYLTKASGDTLYQPVGNYLSGNALSGYATEQWVENKGYLTEHQPIKTINNEQLVGYGNIDIPTGTSVIVDSSLSSASTNPVQNKVITSAITSLSGQTEDMYDKSEVNTLLGQKANAADVYNKQDITDLLVDKSNVGHTHTTSDITNFPTKLVSGATQGYTISVLTQQEWASVSGNPSNDIIYLIKE